MEDLILRSKHFGLIPFHFLAAANGRVTCCTYYAAIVDRITAGEHWIELYKLVTLCFAGGGMRIWWVVACISLLDSTVMAQSLPPYPAMDETGAIQIVTGTFGSLGRNRKLDITARTQELCGSGARSCQIFCSETSYGRYALGRTPICRVTYRCGAGSVRSVEAAREEPILMRCRESDSPTSALSDRR